MTKIAILTVAFALSGCAAQPEDVIATYVSPNTYAGYSCRQIISERNQVVGKVNELTGTQEKKANNDAVAMGVGVILFWPALLFMADGNSAEAQLASMKGTFDALTAAGTQKGCF